MHVAMPLGGPLQIRSVPRRDLTWLQKDDLQNDATATARGCSRQHEPTDETAPVEAESLPGGTVLLVSDDDSLRAILRAYLEHVGKRVRCCADAAHVPELFVRSASLDLLLVDISWAEAPELRLAAELTAQFPELPVIVLCAESQTLAKIAEGCPKGWRLVSRPVTLPDLLGLIRSALEKPAGRRAARLPATRAADVFSSRRFDAAAGAVPHSISVHGKRERSEVRLMAVDGLQP